MVLLKDKTDWKAEVDRGRYEPERAQLLEKAAEQQRAFVMFRVVESYPGAGKTREATAAVNKMWEQNGKRGLYLSPNPPREGVWLAS